MVRKTVPTNASTSADRTTDSAADVDADRYERFKAAVLEIVPRGDGVTLHDLSRALSRRFANEMLPSRQSIMQILTAVKIDLESRKLLERVPGATPQRLRRV